MEVSWFHQSFSHNLDSLTQSITNCRTSLEKRNFVLPDLSNVPMVLYVLRDCSTMAMASKKIFKVGEWEQFKTSLDVRNSICSNLYRRCFIRSFGENWLMYLDKLFMIFESILMLVSIALIIFWRNYIPVSLRSLNFSLV